jgi:uncharacterized protein with PIN domain
MKSKTLEDYYLDHFKNIYTPNCCENCDKEIYKLNSSNIAHILPKSKFPSVALEYYNYLLLCGNCHSTFDSSFKKASTMKCFEKAKFRYDLFKNDVEEDHKILNYLK